MSLIFNEPNLLNSDYKKDPLDNNIIVSDYEEIFTLYNNNVLTKKEAVLLYAESKFNNNLLPVSINLVKKEFSTPFCDEVLSLNNDKLKISKISELEFNELSRFDSDFNDELEVINANKFKLSYSDIGSFYNNYDKAKTTTLAYSKGIFPFEDKIGYLANENTTYDDINSLVDTNIEYYWFNSSIPSYKQDFQARVIAWGRKTDNMQLSYKLPKYVTDIEFYVEDISVTPDINIESGCYPKIEDDEISLLEFKGIYSAFEVNFEFAKGAGYITTFNIEYSKIYDITVYPLNLEMSNNFLKINKTNIEYSSGKPLLSNTNIEYQDYVTGLGITNIELAKGLTDIEPLDIEYSRISGVTVNTSVLECLCSETEYYNYNIEYSKVFNEDYDVSLEYSSGYALYYPLNIEMFNSINTNYNLSAEFSLSSLNNSLNLEYSNIDNSLLDTKLELLIPEITKDIINNLELNVENINTELITNIEYSRVYVDDYSFNLEYEDYNATKSFELPLESLFATKYEMLVNLEFTRPKVAKLNQQTYVIPWGFLNKNFQFYHEASFNDVNNLEFYVKGFMLENKALLEHDVTINKSKVTELEYNIKQINTTDILDITVDIPDLYTDKLIPIEFQSIFEDFYSYNIEYDSSINADYIANIQSDISLNQAYQLSLEYLQKISINTTIDMEFDSVINTEYDTKIEFVISKLNKDYNLSLESFISINDNEFFDLELFVRTVDKTLNLEFDVLDLVYYFIKKGFNILPWNYSEGLGYYDNTVNKNWNKSSPIDSTFLNSFVKQLDDKGLEIPNITSFSDSSLDNWGTIIKNVDNKSDINLSNKILYYENIGEEYTLVMGKRKREPKETILLKKGENLIIWDGIFSSNNPPMFNDKIKPQISDYIDNVGIYDQRTGIWKTLINADHPLYFQKLYQGTLQLMPFIINIKVTDDCSFIINR